jgi:predicted RNA-binding Zn-ribbon protein involved in translation (DUF1610 family)
VKEPKTIRLLTSHGAEILCDEGFEYAAKSWCVNRAGYAVARVDGKVQYMHHLVIPHKDGYVRDHINGNRLDNRAANLRYATRQENTHNMAGHSKSGVKGATYCKRKNRWKAQIRVDGVNKSLGYFDTREEAGAAYAAASEIYHGTFGTTRHKEGPRILVYDIETFPMSVAAWGLFNQNMSIEMIERDWSLMSFCGKWYGEPELFYMDNRDAVDPRDDSAMLPRIHALLAKADMLVAHNGKKFDIRKLNARFLLAGLPPLPPIPTIDTLLIARRNFANSSSKLAYLTDKLTQTKKLSHAKFPGFSLWAACATGDEDAWEECRTYNIADVLSLEELYTVLRPWAANHPNLGNYAPDETEGAHKCPNCGSTHVIRKGLRHTQVGQYTRYHCQGCGAWSRGRLMTNTKAHRANLLVS